MNWLVRDFNESAGKLRSCAALKAGASGSDSLIPVRNVLPWFGLLFNQGLWGDIFPRRLESRLDLLRGSGFEAVLPFRP
jgi:hypothetical protein